MSVKEVLKLRWSQGFYCIILIPSECADVYAMKLLALVKSGAYLLAFTLLICSLICQI